MKISDIILKIDKNQQEIDAHGKLGSDILKKIDYKFRLDWNYYSNRMEGGTLTREETRSVMVGNIDVKGKPLKDVLEMNGHDRMVLDVLEMGKGEDKLSEKRIKEIHKAIMYEDDPEKQKLIGEWKTTPNEIINYKNEKIRFTEPWEVREAVHKLLDKTKAALEKCWEDKSPLHPLEIAAQFHIDFVTIHPFYDGNGRTTRILTNIILISCGFPPIIIKEEYKKAYYQLLADIQAYGGEPDLFYAFLGERLLESQELVLSAIRGENIEEENDLNKEISIWKKQLTSETEVISKSNELIAGLYEHSLRPLFERFLQDHAQFDELFLDKRLNNRINNISKDTKQLDFFDLWVGYAKDYKEFMIESQSASILDQPLFHDKYPIYSKYEFERFTSITDFEIQLYYSGFKKNGPNAFGRSTGFQVIFNEFNYLVTDRYNQGKTYLKKLYSETLTKAEISAFVKDRVREFFEEIKQTVAQNKQ